MTFEKTSVDLKVRLWGPFWWTVSRDVEYSEHGPVIRQDHGTYAVRYAGMGEVGNIDQRLAMNKAENLDELAGGHGHAGLALDQLCLCRC